jgi:hypothetical protein
MNQTLLELGKKFRALKDQSEAKDDELKLINKAWDECEAELIQAMIDDCINSFDIEGVGKISLARSSFLSVNAQNKEKFYKYLQDSGNGALLKLDVNPRTLGAFLKDHEKELTKKFMDEAGIDEIDAKAKADEVLKEHGAAIFAKTQIRLLK